MHDEAFKLTRRKALAGLATVGAAGAGAGLGTSALFSDEEEFTGNQFTAGTLDMAVTGEVVAQNGEYPVDIRGDPVTADGSVVDSKLVVQDVKPGDWFIVEFTVDSVAENPFYITLHGDTLEEREGAATDPENGVDGDTSDDGWDVIQPDHSGTNAELGDKLLISYWEQWGGTGLADLENLDNITNAATNDFYVGTRGALANGGDPDEDGVVVGQTSPEVEYTNAREFYYGDPSTTTSNDPLGNGFASGDGILVGGTTDPVEVGSTDSSEITRRRMSDPDSDGEAELVFYLAFEIAEEVGNEIQGDAVRGNLRFNAEQVRNNSDPRSGRV